jgi:catechol 2,3-dioxygenase-like lactoylglutathione lyase family enzyme
MKLEFLYTPTRDLQASLALYRDELGWEEAWREGDSTASLKVPGSDVQLMLDATSPGRSHLPPAATVATLVQRRWGGTRALDPPDDGIPAS